MIVIFMRYSRFDFDGTQDELVVLLVVSGKKENKIVVQSMHSFHYDRQIL